MANGVSLPTLTVTVTAAEAPTQAPPEAGTKQEISAFVEPDVIEIPLDDTRSETDIMATFPDFVLATVNGIANTEVPVSGWSRVFPAADIDFSAAASGEYFYAPSLDETAYTILVTAILPNQVVEVGEVTHGPQLTAEVGDFTVTGGNPATDYSYADGVLTITGDGALTIANTNQSIPTKHRIVVAAGVNATLTLAGVNIDLSSIDAHEIPHPAFLIEATATATITLEDASTNTLKGGSTANGAPGLEVPEGATLTLKGTTGSLSATSDVNGAGIGGRLYQSSGTIKIEGGHITATGANGGAGIGGGPSNYFGGSGDEGVVDEGFGHGGTTTISGGTVTATGASGGAGIGGGGAESYRAVGGSGGIINISGGNVTATGADGGAGIGGGANSSKREVGHNYYISDAGTITISGDAIITRAEGSDNGAGIGGGIQGKVNSITISDTAEITRAQGGYNSAGIGGGNEGDTEGSIIEIKGGTVTANGGNNGAGIGGGNKLGGGTITISDGTVTATGGSGGAAGIGGGASGAGGNITISGGTVTATGSSGAANIGGAGIGGGSSAAGGTIIIEGTAQITLAQGGDSAAGIGGGSLVAGGSYATGGTITIQGSAQITLARGGEDGAGIGGGENGVGGIIKILGSSAVTANGNNGGAGIGGGSYGNGGNITISSGTVSATGGNYGAGIGGGYSDHGGTIKIEGGTVTALGGEGAAGIGGGDNGNGNTIAISGGTVAATGGEKGAGIGGGVVGNGGNITISGDAVITKAQGGTGDPTSSGGSYRGGAGIGGGLLGSGGNITISGGAIKLAQGGENAAGIGGGYLCPGGTITISGGTVAAALGGAGAAGIGDGNNVSTSYTPGTFSTSASGGTAGTAFIMASSISDNDNTSGWSGVIFGGDASNPNDGYFYGTNADFILRADAEVPLGKTLHIPSGKTFSINTGATLTNKGTIYKLGTLNHGTATYGTLVNQGLILPEDNPENPGFSLVAVPVYLRENSGEKQYSLDRTNWFSYTGNITLSGTTNAHFVQVQSGEHNITLNGVGIDVSGGNVAFDIQGTATVNLTLANGSTNTLSSEMGAGLQVQENATLHITHGGTGALSATGGTGGAGIGISTAGGSAGTVIISGGTVTVTGGTGAQAFSAKPDFALPTPSANTYNRVTIMAGADAGSAAARELASNYHEQLYAQITTGTATPVISITQSAALRYNGTRQTQSVAVKLGDASLAEGTHYTLSGNEETEAGTYTLTATLDLSTNSAYDGTEGTNYLGGSAMATESYSIAKAALTVTGVTTQSRAYNGTADVTVSGVTFSGLVNNEQLAGGTDYALSNLRFVSADAGDNVAVSGVISLENTAVANNYSMSSASFSVPSMASITPQALAVASVTLGQSLTANGTEQTQSVSAVVLNGKTLVEGTDYTVSGNTATNAGGYTLIITGTGNYMGTLTVPFTVVGTAEEALPYESTGTLDKENSTVPSGNTLHITPQSEAKQQQDLAKLREYAQQHDITGTVHFLADLTMTDAAGNEVQPENGNTRVRISVPGLTMVDTVTVLHIKDDGTVEEIRPVDVHNGYVEFAAPSFSTYSVIVHKAQSTGGAGITSALSPQTGTV